MNFNHEFEFFAQCNDGEQDYDLFRHIESGDMVRVYEDGSEAEATDIDYELYDILSGAED